MDKPVTASMLRSPVELAVSEVGRMAVECAEHFRDAARLLPGDGLARSFEEFALRHDAIAGAMADASRALGDLPREPDADREALQRVLRAVKSALSSDEHKLLAEERIADEHGLLAKIDQALALELAAPLRARLLECREAVEEVLRRLATPPPHA